MFRNRQSLVIPLLTRPSFFKSVFNPDGSVTREFLDPFAKLPSIENFKLKHLLSAGVPLEQVNSVLFESLPSAEQIVADSKPVDSKPVDSKPADSNPADSSSN